MHVICLYIYMLLLKYMDILTQFYVYLGVQACLYDAIYQCAFGGLYMCMLLLKHMDALTQFYVCRDSGVHACLCDARYQRACNGLYIYTLLLTNVNFLTQFYVCHDSGVHACLYDALYQYACDCLYIYTLLLKHMDILTRFYVCYDSILYQCAWDGVYIYVLSLKYKGASTNSITDSTDNATPLKPTKSTNSNIPRCKFELIQNLHLDLSREIPRNPSFSICGFRGCSIFSGNWHVCAMIQSYISVREMAYTYVHVITLNLGAFSQDKHILSMWRLVSVNTYV